MPTAVQQVERDLLQLWPLFVAKLEELLLVQKTNGLLDLLSVNELKDLWEVYEIGKQQVSVSTC